MLVAICIVLAFLVVVLTIALLLQSRRPVRQDGVSETRRRRAVLEDRGDDVLWEVGRMRPIVDVEGFEPKLSKRSFLRQAAFTASAFLAAWLASHGKNVALGAEAPRSKSPEKDPFGHEGLAAGHADLHSDGNGGGKNHGDVHTDAAE